MCEIAARYQIQKLQAARAEVQKCKQEALHDAEDRLKIAKKDLKNEESSMPCSYDKQSTLKYRRVWKCIEDVRLIEEQVKDLSDAQYSNVKSSPKSTCLSTTTSPVFSIVQGGGLNCQNFFAKISQPWRRLKPPQVILPRPQLPSVSETVTLLSDKKIITSLTSELAHPLSSIESLYEHPELENLVREVISISEGPLHILEGNPSCGKTTLVVQSVVKISDKKIFSGGLFMIDADEPNSDPIMKMGKLISGELPKQVVKSVLRKMLSESCTPVLLVFDGVHDRESVFEIAELLPVKGKHLSPSKIIISTSVGLMPVPIGSQIHSVAIDSVQPEKIFNTQPATTAVSTSAAAVTEIASAITSGKSSVVVVIIPNCDSTIIQSITSQLQNNLHIENAFSNYISMASDVGIEMEKKKFLKKKKLIINTNSHNCETFKRILDSIMSYGEKVLLHWVCFMTFDNYKEITTSSLITKRVSHYQNLLEISNISTLQWSAADLVQLIVSCKIHYSVSDVESDAAPDLSHYHSLINSCSGNITAINIACALDSFQSSCSFARLSSLLSATVRKHKDSSLLRNKKIFKPEHSSGNALAVLLKTAFGCVGEKAMKVLWVLAVMNFDSGPIPISVVGENALKEVGESIQPSDINDSVAILCRLGIVSVSCCENGNYSITIPRLIVTTIRHTIPSRTLFSIHKAIINDILTSKVNSCYLCSSLTHHAMSCGMVNEEVSSLVLSLAAILTGVDQFKELLSQNISVGFEISLCSSACIGLHSHYNNSSVILSRLYQRLEKEISKTDGSPLRKLFKLLCSSSVGAIPATMTDPSPQRMLWLKFQAAINLPPSPVLQKQLLHPQLPKNSFLQYIYVEGHPGNRIVAVSEHSGIKNITIWRFEPETSYLTIITEVCVPCEPATDGDVSALALACCENKLRVFMAIKGKLISLECPNRSLPTTLRAPLLVSCHIDCEDDISQLKSLSDKIIISYCSLKGDWFLHEFKNNSSIVQKDCSELFDSKMSVVCCESDQLKDSNVELICSGNSSRITSGRGMTLFNFMNGTVEQHSTYVCDEVVTVLCVLSTGWMVFLKGTISNGELSKLHQIKTILCSDSCETSFLSSNYFYTATENGLSHIYSVETFQLITRFSLDVDDKIIGFSTIGNALRIFVKQSTTNHVEVFIMSHQNNPIKVSTTELQQTPGKVMYSENGIVNIKLKGGSYVSYDAYTNIGTKLPSDFVHRNYKKTRMQLRKQIPTTDRFVLSVERSSSVVVFDSVLGVHGAVQTDSEIISSTLSHFRDRALLVVMTCDGGILFYEIFLCLLPENLFS